jgi:hypothetical protein
VNRVDVEFLRFCISLLDWGALYGTSDVDEHVSLLADFIDLLFVFRCGGSLFLIRG